MGVFFLGLTRRRRFGLDAPQRTVCSRVSRQASAERGQALSISDEEALEREERALAEHARLPAKTVYQIVRQEGQEQMERPAVSLWWSGFAGGLSISFSLLGEATLMRALPDAPWRPLVASLGYSIGFLMVILARQQLFTETTITVVLPLLAEFTRRNLMLMARMWGLVLAANFAGTLVAALFCSLTPVLEPSLRQAMLDVSMHTMAHGWFEMLVRGISAGFLIAVLVWLMPSAEGAEFQMITVLTYLIAVGGFQHIVAGSMEAFMLVLAGQQSVAQILFGFLIPVLVGNVLGGTALFGVLSYAQVMKEI
jgi:formate/nitrite transporter FocA (FNT family)